MNIGSVTNKPRLQTELLVKGDHDTQGLLKQVDRLLGAAMVVQTAKGRFAGLRLNEDTSALEYYDGSAWKAVTGETVTQATETVTKNVTYGSAATLPATSSVSGDLSVGGKINVGGTVDGVDVSTIPGLLDLKAPLASPTFSGTVTIGTLDGILKAATGVVGTATIGTSLSYAAGTLNTIQGIRTVDSPVFAGLTVGSLAGILKGTAGVLSAAVAGTDYPGLASANTFSAAQTIQKDNVGIVLDGTNAPLVLDNQTVATGSSDYQSTKLYAKAYGWSGSANQLAEWALVFNAMGNNNPTLYLRHRKAGGSWTTLQAIDSNGAFTAVIKRSNWGLVETIPGTAGLQLYNDAPATVTEDQSTPTVRLYSRGWRSGAGSGTTYCSWDILGLPDAGVTYPNAVLKIRAGQNTQTPDTDIANFYYDGTYGYCDILTAYRVNGTQVVGAQQAAISAPSGGATVDAEARTAIGSILSALRTHGLIAT